MYIVVRCRGRDTLPLMGALQERQLDGWTPRIQQRVRVARKRKVITLIRPAMPSFLFVAESDVAISVALGDVRAIPQHSVFLFNGAPMGVDAKDLRGLRQIDTPDERAAPMLPVATLVNIVAGPFAGHRGAVIGHAAGYMEVCLEKSQLVIKMTPFFVRPVPL